MDSSTCSFVVKRVLQALGARWWQVRQDKICFNQEWTRHWLPSLKTSLFYHLTESRLVALLMTRLGQLALHPLEQLPLCVVLCHWCLPSSVSDQGIVCIKICAAGSHTKNEDFDLEENGQHERQEAYVGAEILSGSQVASTENTATVSRKYWEKSLCKHGRSNSTSGEEHCVLSSRRRRDEVKLSQIQYLAVKQAQT